MGFGIWRFVLDHSSVPIVHRFSLQTANRNAQTDEPESITSSANEGGDNFDKSTHEAGMLFCQIVSC